MVFFSCDGCGEMLRKNQVDGHATRWCRQGCSSVSCVDCNVAFPGDSYRNHTSCVTESERYEKRSAGKGGNTMKSGRKKINPQESWMELIQSAATATSRTVEVDQLQSQQRVAGVNLHAYLSKMALMDNIPRKERPFRNYCANSLLVIPGRTDLNHPIITELWEYLQLLRQQQQQRERQHSAKPKEEEAAAAAKIPANTVTKIDQNLAPDVEKELKNQTLISNEIKASSTASSSEIESKLPGMTEQINMNDETSTAIKGLDRKLVKRAMKRCLKKGTKHSMHLKELRKAVRIELGMIATKNKKIVKVQIKELIQQTLQEESCVGVGPHIFVVDGKTVSIKIQNGQGV